MRVERQPLCGHVVLEKEAKMLKAERRGRFSVGFGVGDRRLGRGEDILVGVNAESVNDRNGGMS